MTEDFAWRTARSLLPVAVLIVALGCGGPSSPTQNIPPAPPTQPAPPQGPAPVPVSTRYHASGIVKDDNGSPVANADVAVENLRGYKQATTSTNAGGCCKWSSRPARRATFIWSTLAAAASTTLFCQSAAFGHSQHRREPHLSRSRTFEAGQSIVISIDPDSSIAYDGEDWWAFHMVWEKLHVRVAEAGTLTIDVRPAGSGIIPSLAVFCFYVTDNCLLFIG